MAENATSELGALSSVSHSSVEQNPDNSVFNNVEAVTSEVDGCGGERKGKF